jgi:hypothetical protein
VGPTADLNIVVAKRKFPVAVGNRSPVVQHLMTDLPCPSLVGIRMVIRI